MTIMAVVYIFGHFKYFSRMRHVLHVLHETDRECHPLDINKPVSHSI